MQSPARILVVTVGLALAGGAIGATLGAVLFAVLGPGFTDSTNVADFLSSGAIVGGALGSFIAPLIAWLLMRDIPLWRAVLETAVGTVVGCAIGLALDGKLPITGPSPLFAGVAGFVVAALRLRLTRRWRARRSSVDAQAG